jgi:prolyl-tRNA synthetase
MRYSQFVGKTVKLEKAYDSMNATLLQKGGYIEPLMSGVVSYLPLGLRVLKNIEKIVRDEMSAIGALEILMPAMEPKENWELTKRAEDYKDIFFELKTDGAGIVLGPTHEEIVTPLIKKQISSYQDLPKGVFQIQTKFRKEARSKSGLLRGREFLMKDLYSFHTDEKDLDVYYEKVQQAYVKIFDRLGLGKITLKTFASGGTFSKYSHEYQTLSGVGEDTIYVCEKCNVAVNKEIIDEQKACPECGSTDLKEKTSIEVGNIFKLGTRFSDAFGFTYSDKDGSRKSIPMGCYGIGISRLMGTIVEVFNDGKAIFWPASVAPFDIQLTGLNLEDEAVRKNAEIVYEQLVKAGKSVLFDDRVDVSAGEKFADADLIGIPKRYIISKRTGDKPEIQEISIKK